MVLETLGEKIMGNVILFSRPLENKGFGKVGKCADWGPINKSNTSALSHEKNKIFI